MLVATTGNTAHTTLAGFGNCLRRH